MFYEENITKKGIASEWVQYRIAGKGSLRHLHQDLKGGKEYAVEIWLGKSIPGRGNIKCKGPEAVRYCRKSHG